MSLTERAGLVPVLLLTGCAVPAVVTGPPSGSVVDGYLSRSASDISAMQFRIHQSGPAAQRPVSRSSLMPRGSAAAAGDVKPVIPGAQMIRTGTGPADGFIRGGGVAPTLRAALQKIVPPDHKIIFSDPARADAPELWKWEGNDRWPYVVRKLLAGSGSKAVINGQAKTVSVEPEKDIKAAKTSVTKASAVPVMVNGASAAPQAPINRNPFHGGPQTVPLKPAVASVPVLPAAPVMKAWKIEKGTTLRQGYSLWASQERCGTESGSWSVRWDTSTDYPIDYPLTFRAASFEEATTQLFNLWSQAQVPLFVSGYRNQCLIVISDGR